MKFNKRKYSNRKLIALYTALIKPRLIEEKMLILLRQGKISKWFSGIGQEAVSVGVAMALDDDEYILPIHRNLGVFTSRNIALGKLFGQFQGKISGFTKGRDRSFHFGSKEHKIIGMISHLGSQMSIADGIALSCELDKEQKVTVVFSGDGGTSEGDFHEAINVAAVWNLPVIFVIENNGYGLSTPSSQQFKCNSFIEKGAGYGIAAYQVDGNNILDVHALISRLAKQMRNKPSPVIVEAITFRMRGHEEASGTKYVASELLEYWSKKDPIINYEDFLIKEKILSKKLKASIHSAIKEEIEDGLEEAFEAPFPSASVEAEVTDLYAPHKQYPDVNEHRQYSKKRFVDAVSDGLRQSLEKYPELVFMGQDIAEYGGVFKVSEGFIEQFGSDRIRNTPLCESAILGAAMGLSIKGKKAVVEMQFADFVTCGFNQIVNNLAKAHYRWGQNVDVVIRMPTGAGVGAGPFHSQSNEAWFTHTPGLKVLYPSSPYQVKGLLTAAIEDPNPIMYFEHKALYRSISEEIPNEYYTCEIGKARVVKEGSDMSIITYGMGVHWAIDAAKDFFDINIEIIDLQTLLPWDKESVKETIKKTGRALILHEDCLTGGFGGEIAAWIGEHCFTYLDAPVLRVGSLDTPVPFAAPLENNFLANRLLTKKINELAEF